MTIPIFCINLERATERRQFVEEQWVHKHGIDIVFWKAFDRRRIDIFGEYIYPHEPEIAAENTGGRLMSSGEIACATSHCMLYEHLLAEGHEEVIVMEDDITPTFMRKEGFFKRVKQARVEFPQLEAVLLHKPHVKWESEKTGKYFSVLKHSPFGNQCTYFTRKGLEIAVEDLSSGNVIADHIWNRVFTPQGLLGLATPPLVHHLHKTTYIGNEGRGTIRDFFE